jgi:hypothetical protein
VNGLRTPTRGTASGVGSQCRALNLKLCSANTRNCDTVYHRPSRMALPSSGHGHEGEAMTPIEQTLYQYLVAPVIRDCGAHSPEAQLAYETWARIVGTLEPDRRTQN